MKIIVKMDTGHTFEHADAEIRVATWLHVLEGQRERMYNSERILWIEKERGKASPHKSIK